MADLDNLKPMVNLTVGDLLEERKDYYSKSTMFNGRVIARNAFDGRIRFDTRNNKREFVATFFDYSVRAMWVEMREVLKPNGYICTYEPVLCCYISHVRR